MSRKQTMLEYERMPDDDRAKDRARRIQELKELGQLQMCLVFLMAVLMAGFLIAQIMRAGGITK